MARENKINTCIDCDRSIHIKSQRCVSCNNKFRWLNSKYKNRMIANLKKRHRLNKKEKIIKYCIDCKKIVKGFYAIRCLKCTRIFSGINLRGKRSVKHKKAYTKKVRSIMSIKKKLWWKKHPDLLRKNKTFFIPPCKLCKTIKKSSHSIYCKSCSNKVYPRCTGHTKESIRKISLAKGGTGVPRELSEYGTEFDNALKEQVRFRDKYKCRLCGCSQLENGKQLDVHHIDYNKFHNIIKNLISLCKSCHSKTNVNREYWRKYFTNLYSVRLKQ